MTDDESVEDIDPASASLAELPYLIVSAEEWRRAYVLSLMANSDIHPWILVDNMSAVENWLKTGENTSAAPSGVKPRVQK
jgi:hypothetical protein